ncbi:MAG: molybdenum cofactor guanylyltransferase [Candidatus Methanomethylicia archaeon]|nr:molybdenum cofactor guanylyltransferase [Candidatus Methanomethylicia archaeon]MCQ5374579.1 molybdenum cofactor guanylyltransferase [Candidatus Methanomethylicia archaeon]NHV59872.1 molybdenum cofactor guanylyltransferase [Candidatus Verstraetearchaeota archaeon]
MVRDIAVVILAGGRSSRVGSYKPLLELAGRPLISYAIEFALFTTESPYIIVSSSAQAKTLMDLNCVGKTTIIVDPEGSEGPFSAVASLSRIHEDFIFLIGCDTPFLEPRLPIILHHHLGNSSGVVPMWPNGYLEPLAALYRRKVLSEVRSAKSFREILDIIGAKKVSIEKLGIRPESFFNINTLSDLKKAELFLNIFGKH